MKIEKIREIILKWINIQIENGQYVMTINNEKIEDIDLVKKRSMIMDGNFDLNELAELIMLDSNSNSNENTGVCLHKNEYLEYFPRKNRVICKICGEVWENKSTLSFVSYNTNDKAGESFRNYPDYPVTC